MFSLPEEVFIKPRDGEEPVKVKIIPNNYEECPGCGALWGHTETKDFSQVILYYVPEVIGGLMRSEYEGEELK